MQKFGVIMADPPWPEQGGGKVVRGAQRHYDLMSLKDIVALPVEPIVEDDAMLFLWVTNSYLLPKKRGALSAIDVVHAWGFEYRNKFTWTKYDRDRHCLQRPGLGQWTRGTDEVCLFCVRGKPAYPVDETGKRIQYPNSLLQPRTEHSRKPAEMMIRAEMMGKALGARLEMFARSERPGWTSIGNGIDGADISDSLRRLAD